MSTTEGLQLLVVTTLSCAHAAPPEPFVAPWHLGESTASRGSDPTRSAPLEPDDPRTIDVSRPLRQLPETADVNLERPIYVGRYMSRDDEATEIYDQPGVFSPPPPPPGYR